MYQSVIAPDPEVPFFIPVSYTHLDVYKRQQEPFPGSESTPIFPPSCVMILWQIERPRPVPGKMCIRDRVEINKFRTTTFIYFTVSYSILFVLKVSSCMFECIQTVSYTHLDVYKRQFPH